MHSACREVASYGRRKRVFLGNNCSPCAGVTCQGNHFEFIPTVSMKSQHSTGGPTCHDFARFVIVSEKSIAEVGNRWLRSSQNGGFHKCFPKPQQTSRKYVFLCKFREIWPSESRWNRALFNGQKKHNFGSRSRCHLCADRARNLSGTAPHNILGVPQISSKSVHFRRSYSRTREHRWNAPQSILL